MNCLLCVFSRLLDVCRTICKTQGEWQPNREFAFYLGKNPIFCGFLPFSSRIFAQKNAKKAFFFSNRNCQKKKRLFVDTFLCCLHPLRPTTHRRHRHKKYVSNDTTFSPYVNNFEKLFLKLFFKDKQIFMSKQKEIKFYAVCFPKASGFAIMLLFYYNFFSFEASYLKNTHGFKC